MFTILKHPRIRIFLLISVLIGIALVILQLSGAFVGLDLQFYGMALIDMTPHSNVAVEALIILFFALISGILILVAGNERGLFYNFALWLVYGIIVWLSVQQFGFILPITAPLIATLIGIIRVMGWGTAFLEQEKAELNRMFGYFLDNEVLKYLIQNPHLIRTTGTSKTLTILFADIRGFTARAEALPPETVIAMLRRYFGEMIPIIRRHGGTVDKLIGDAIMAFFGDPIPQDNHAERAALAALEMQQKMTEIAAEWARDGVEGIQIGIGLNTDTVVVGNIGSEEFYDYTVLGRGVNLASRLESKCPGGDIHVSQTIHDSLQNRFTFEFIGEQSYKNIQQPVPVYRLLSPQSTSA